MGCKTVGKFTTDTATAIAVSANGYVPFNGGTTSNSCEALSGNNVVQIRKAGLYRISFNGAFTSPAADPLNVQLVANGVLRDGAHAIVSPEVAGNINSVAFSDVITASGYGVTTLAVQSVNATSVNIANLIVEKIA